MKTSFFNYDLPEELIAQVPLKDRDASRLLVCRSSSQTIEDYDFENISSVLQAVFSSKEKNSKILLLVNDSRVYPARVRIKRKTGGRGEVFILEKGYLPEYSCLLRPLSKLKVGEVLYSDSENPAPLFTVSSLNPPKVKPFGEHDLNNILEVYGEMPLPPYIQRGTSETHKLCVLDKERYQTVYSNVQECGSSAAPTAGLHFSQNIIEQCKSNNIEFASVTLHVGLGTFLPVQSEEVLEHKMHEEIYCIPHETVQKLCHYLENDWPIVYVGTTSLRAVESFFKKVIPGGNKKSVDELVKNRRLSKILTPFSNSWHATNIFIYPKSKSDKVLPCVGNGIITNFHQPESTLVMLVAALVGFDFWKKMYKHAIENKYRFFSYGDSSLLIFGDQF